MRVGVCAYGPEIGFVAKNLIMRDDIPIGLFFFYRFVKACFHGWIFSGGDADTAQRLCVVAVDYFPAIYWMSLDDLSDKLLLRTLRERHFLCIDLRSGKKQNTSRQ